MPTDTSNYLKSYYQSLYKEYGDSHKAVQHVSKEAQNVRFDIFLKLISKKSKVIDLGCGLADMLIYFRENGFQGEYLGYDLVPEFIESAKNKFANDQKAEFAVFDIYQDDIAKGYDHILISGVFNNKMSDNLAFLDFTIAKSFSSARKSVVFNALSTYVDFFDDSLFYVSPVTLLDEFKRNLTPFIFLKHDYVTKENGFPYEFTMKLSKKADS
ncbi:class I SAM-dependent methyltransferase [Pseudoalteromonas sp. KG3]|uniref:class I SAM-dependent methyltransferase n=1 Tax=Pseudoalteromonas sp. KG3 TaxID=2951137 RepID=UPI00265945D1|nr:class I SAM-dependent methyltransferase [Pseudoalteromonas sp. KG3]WKD24683.1 class I SAM-dependent methyltransferase [Pseudoalteromonas sp. KG3]